MTLNDLTTFDICKFKNGTFAMVFPNKNDLIYGLSLWSNMAITLCYLCKYNFDFTCKMDIEDAEGYNIVKIYKPLFCQCGVVKDFFNGKLDESYFLKNHDLFSLIWQRKEPKKLTIKEISELLGYEVEIIAEK